MIDHLAFSSAAQTRRRVFASFQDAMDGIRHEESKLAVQLRGLAPSGLVGFLVRERVISMLFALGTFQQTVSYNDEPYPFSNAEAVKKAFTDLETAWRGAVRVSFEEKNGGIEVTITTT